MIGIYAYTNKSNGKIYIGKSKDIEARFVYHAIYFKNDKKNTFFYNALKKYSLSNFDKIVLEECAFEDLNERESYYIRQFKSDKKENGYNLTSGGDGGDTFSNKNEILKEITRKKFKKIMTENPQGIVKRSIRGKHITETAPEIKDKWEKNFNESMKKLSLRRSSGNFTDAEKRFYYKLKKSRIGKGNGMYKGSYYIYNHLDKLIGTHDSIRIVCKETGISYSTVSKSVLKNWTIKSGKFKGYRIKRKKLF